MEEQEGKEIDILKTSQQEQRQEKGKWGEKEKEKGKETDTMKLETMLQAVYLRTRTHLHEKATHKF